MGRRLAIIALALTALLAMPSAASAFDLRNGTNPDRQSWNLLDGFDLSGNAYIHVHPSEGGTEVRFWLDDPTRAGAPRKTEFGAPWDFAGTAANGLANPFNTATVVNGTHNVTAVVTLTAGGTEVVSANFTVSNPLPPDQIHLAWADDPSSSFTAVWRTRSPATPSTLEYRELGDATWIDVGGSMRPATIDGRLNEATVSALDAGTAYEYRVLGDGGAWSAPFVTRTAPTGHTPFDAIFLADTGIAGRADGLAAGTQQVLDKVGAFNPLVLLLGGDYAHLTGDARFTQTSAIDAWFNQAQPLLSRIPGMPTYGEREQVFEDQAAWADRFPTPSGIDGTYAFDVGDAHFISILAAVSPGGVPQQTFDWIEQDIIDAKARGQRWIIPYMHQPAFSSGQHHGSNFDLRAQFGPLFAQHGVEIVLSAHDESYERTYPLGDVSTGNNPTSTVLSCYGQTDGVTWVKTSPGGMLSYPGGGFSALTNPKPYWSALRDNTMHHFLRLRVFGDSLRVEAWGVNAAGGDPVLLDGFRYRAGGACAPNYPRPGGGSPLTVPLVPAYSECTAPNSRHVAPLDHPSCTSATRESSLVAMSEQGRGVGSVRLDVKPGVVGTPEDEADIKLRATISDVRVAGSTTDYAGSLLFRASARITDHGGAPFAEEPVTVQDTELSVPMTCTETPASLAGSSCSVDTTADALVPGFVTEGRRTIISTLAVEVLDAGADGIVDPGTSCPLVCGNGDESVFVRQGVFTP